MELDRARAEFPFVEQVHLIRTQVGLIEAVRWLLKVPREPFNRVGVGLNSGRRSGPRNLDSGLSGISIVFQAAVPKPVVPKYTTSGVRRPSEL